MDLAFACAPEPAAGGAFETAPATPQVSASAAFAVVAEPCPQILCRLLGLIAQQGRVVERVEAQSRPDRLDVRIVIAGMEAHAAEIVAAKMQGLATVRSVRLSCAASGPGGADGASLPN